MSLDGVLSILEERGLSVHVDPDGNPKLRGPKEEVTDALKEALAVYRAEIIERFRPKEARTAMRRIVLLTDGRDSEMQRVLEELPAVGCLTRLRELAAICAGSMLALEWPSERGWVRYTWIQYPAKEGEHAPTETIT